MNGSCLIAFKVLRGRWQVFGMLRWKKVVVVVKPTNRKRRNACISQLMPEHLSIRYDQNVRQKLWKKWYGSVLQLNFGQMRTHFGWFKWICCFVRLKQWRCSTNTPKYPEKALEKLSAQLNVWLNNVFYITRCLIFSKYIKILSNYSLEFYSASKNAYIFRNHVNSHVFALITVILSSRYISNFSKGSRLWTLWVKREGIFDCFVVCSLLSSCSNFISRKLY